MRSRGHSFKYSNSPLLKTHPFEVYSPMFKSMHVQCTLSPLVVVAESYYRERDSALWMHRF